MPLVDMSAYNNRPRYFQDALQSYIDGRQQDRQSEDAQTRARASVYLQQLMKLPDDQKAAAIQQLPHDLKPYFMDTNALPSHQPTDAEQLQAMADADAKKQWPTLPNSVKQESAYRRANNADTPAEMTKGLYQNDVLSNPRSFAPPMQDAVAIEQKRMLDANQSREGAQFQQEYNGIKLPESKAKISHENAQTAFEAGPHSDAERAKAYAERASGGLSIAKTQSELATGATADLPSMLNALTKRQASLDDFAKKGSDLRAQLIKAASDQGLIAPANEKERSDLVAADNTARLMQDRIAKLRQLAPVVDSPMNRIAIGGLLNASDGALSNFIKGAARNHVDPKVLDYIQELRNLREDQFSLRKYLGNSPVRSDKQVNIMLSQSVGPDAGSGQDVNRMLDVFEPAVTRLIIGNQQGGRPGVPGAPSTGAAPSDVSGGGIYGTYVPGKGLVKH